MRLYRLYRGCRLCDCITLRGSSGCSCDNGTVLGCMVCAKETGLGSPANKSPPTHQWRHGFSSLSFSRKRHAFTHTGNQSHTNTAVHLLRHDVLHRCTTGTSSRVSPSSGSKKVYKIGVSTNAQGTNLMQACTTPWCKRSHAPEKHLQPVSAVPADWVLSAELRGVHSRYYVQV